MSLSWRERIVAARARGGFTEEERRAMLDCLTCFWHDVRTEFGVALCSQQEHDLLGDPVLDRLVFKEAVSAVMKDEPDRAERVLDEMYDRMLTLKREATP